MRRFQPAVLAILCILLVRPTARVVWAEETRQPGKEPVPAVSKEPVPENVQEFFGAEEDGNPVIAPDLQDYFRSLPTHAQKLFSKAVDEELISSPQHAADLLSLKLAPDRMELLLRNNCILCHTDRDMQDEETLWYIRQKDAGGSVLVLENYVNDVHFRKGLSCAGCHGGSPSDTEMSDEIYERWPDSSVRKKDRTWIPGFCGRCHSDPAFMRGFNPGLPTDQLAKYRTSKHGQLLLGKGDSKAAQCVSCHGVHGIQRSNSRKSPTNKMNIPATCGKCHANAEYMAGYKKDDGTPLPTNQLEQYRESVHGKALLVDGDQGAPVCNDCHGNHAAMPPKLSSVGEVCRTCHSGNGQLFDGSRHKQVFSVHGWPECAKCHGTHDVTKPRDEMMVITPGHLCYDCHTKYAPDNPRCNATADHFYGTIRKLEASSGGLAASEEELARKGLDVETLNNIVSEVTDALRQARSAIHAFDRSDFDDVAVAGLQAADKGQEEVEHLKGEYQFRRRGLMLSLLVMVFLALVLYLKIRQIERRQKKEG